MSVINCDEIDDWNVERPASLKTYLINSLESGALLFLPRLAFLLKDEERKFLSPQFVQKKVKNISFNPALQSLKGVVGSATECQQIQAMLARFSQQSQLIIQILFPHYANALQMGRTSFRPCEVSKRRLSYRKDDRLLHVDAFPSSPNHGQRLLRVFSNVNPHGQDRVWRIGEPFASVAQRFLPLIPRPWPGSSQLLRWLKIAKTLRTEYDHLMLQIHDRMKADAFYQQNVDQIQLRLPPGTSWIVQTDHVSHAAMSGQYMFEQTFYLPAQAMLDPGKSPLKILEGMLSRNLV